MRWITIDDDKQQRDFVKNIIGRFCPQAIFAGEAENIQKGRELIEATHPDLVLLDIDMPDGTGFDLLQQLQSIDFHLIFITAFDTYALQAFRVSALDYLLKPTDPEELVATFNKAAETIRSQQLQQQLSVMMQYLQAGNATARRLVLKDMDAIHIVETAEIVYLQAEDNYTNFFLSNGQKMMVAKTLKEYEQLLEKQGFFRCHKSYLFNLAYLKRIEKSDAGAVVLKDGTELPLAIRRREVLLKVLQGM
ncbi:LytR/AlgR family response regulator transcription factor [Rhodoflexus sp.]